MSALTRNQVARLRNDWEAGRAWANRRQGGKVVVALYRVAKIASTGGESGQTSGRDSVAKAPAAFVEREYMGGAVVYRRVRVAQVPNAGDAFTTIHECRRHCYVRFRLQENRGGTLRGRAHAIGALDHQAAIGHDDVETNDVALNVSIGNQ